MCGNRATFSRTETKYFAGGTQVESGQLREITEMQFARLFPNRKDGYTAQGGAKRMPLDERALWPEARWQQSYTEQAQAAIESTKSWSAKTANEVRAAGGVDAWVRLQMTNLYSDHPSIGIPKQRFLVMNSSPPQAIDRVVKWEKTETPTSCGARCRMARGPMCDCVCEGKNHGAGATMSRSRFDRQTDLKKTKQLVSDASQTIERLKDKLKRQRALDLDGDSSSSTQRTEDTLDLLLTQYRAVAALVNENAAWQEIVTAVEKLRSTLQVAQSESARFSRGFKGFVDPWAAMSPDDRREAGKLQIAALKAMPSSPRQKEIRVKLNAILAKYGLDKSPEERNMKSARRAARKTTMANRTNDSFTVQLRWNGMGAPQHRVTFKTLAQAEKEAERLHALYGSLGNPEFPTMKGIVEIEVSDANQPWKNRTVRWFASRPGAKATMANELFRVRIGNATVSTTEFMQYARRFIPNVSRNDFLPDMVEKVNQALAARGDSIRVSILMKGQDFSRYSAKAAFGQKDAYTTSLNKPVTVANCNRMMNIASEAIQYAKSVGDNELLDLAEEVGIECQAIKSRASRPGAKAAFAANDVDLWNLLAKSDVVLARQNANELATLKKYAQKALRMPNFTPPAMAQHGPSLHQIATDTLADIQAFEQAAYRYRNRAPWAGSRAKAAFDAFDPFTAPAKPASWDGKRINLNNKMYKVEPNGDVYDLYDMNTNKKAKSMTAEQLYRAWEQGRIKTIYKRSGAKASFDKNTIVESWTSPKGTRYEAGLWQSYGGTYQPYVTATYSDGGEQLMTLNEKSYATESGARKRLAAVVSRMKSNYSRVGAKAKFEIKVGDRVLGSLAVQGGAGVMGTVFKIEDGYAHIQADPSVDDERWGRKTYKVPLRLVTRMSRSGAAAAFGNEGIQKGLSRLLKETGFKAMSQDILKGGSDAETLRKYIRVLKSKMSPLHGDERAAQLLDTLDRQLMSRSGAKEKFGQVTQLLGYIESQAHDQRELAKSNLRKLAENIGRIDHTDAEWKHFVRVAHSLGFTDSQIAGFSRRGAKEAFAEPQSFRDLVAYARFHFNLNFYQAQDVAGRAGIMLKMHPNKYPVEMVMQEALKRSNAALTAEQKAPDYRVGSNIKGNPTMRDSSLVMSRSSAKASVAEELHKASTEGRLMKQNVAGTKTTAFNRIGEEEAFGLGAASESDDPSKDENLIALANRVGREHTVNLFKCWSEGKASMQRAATMFSANMYYSVQATVGNDAVGERTAQTVEEAKRFAYSMLDATKQNARGKTVVVDVIPVKNYEPQASVLTLRG
jgi:hypothetical protein